ncbi:MAG: putative selenium-dependent hydroxylase accessory protein YqeC [Deltaproteobacteria bacterium]|nr:putative selenium-dependent hydroxylase accessory protein YqeC [Deltaproteobacteria bacterium]MBW1922797.1 putative selenium-dependent hydroxylase accessory protein YqeC [Deltaproteobacteria bacterium]MBW1949998.1 putative selenium-dependent hydroxylase accessory protein YqeC [Deltaproteobacteria bacterium]MBW2008305.1 putative selenium-dependent hydroxylase accessory protein YqeC [Deltaproteobacteria bacterium]
MYSKGIKEVFEALALGPREHLALVGGGGKTTLLFALARALRARGDRVVTTTTTKVWEPESRAAPCRVFAGAGPDWRDEVRRGLERYGHVFVGVRVLASEKVSGMPVEDLDDLFRERAVDFLLVEADGAARKPLKAPAPHEPVIPASATVVVALAGLDALGKPLSGDTVFRPERVAVVTGIAPGGKITAEGMTALFTSSAGLFKGCPDGARKIAFMNKLDIPNGPRHAEAVAQCLLASDVRPDRVVAASLAKGSYVLYEADHEGNI